MARKPSATAPTQHDDPIEEFAQLAGNDAREAIKLMFWKARMSNPGFTFEVTAADLTAFRACVGYLEVTPVINIFRPDGAPPVEAIPATGNRRAIPARPARPPKNYVVIQMVDQDGNAIVPVESDEADHAKSKQAQRLRAIRESAPSIATQLVADVQANALSNETILRAAEALRLLSTQS